MHGLVVPDALAGLGVQRQNAIAEEVLPLTEPAVEIVTGGSGGAEDPAACFVERETAPGVGTAVDLVFDELPGVKAELA